MKKRGIYIGTGIVSLLVVFCILCMVILTTLTYLEASQSEALAIREKEQLEQYYQTEKVATSLYLDMKEKKHLSFEALAEEVKQKAKDFAYPITITQERDILEVEIVNENNASFIFAVDQQLQIQAWGYGKEQ